MRCKLYALPLAGSVYLWAAGCGLRLSEWEDVQGWWPAEGLLLLLLALSRDSQINKRPKRISRVQFNIRAADFLHLRTGFCDLRLKRKMAEELTLAGMIILCLSLLSSLAHFGKKDFYKWVWPHSSKLLQNSGYDVGSGRNSVTGFGMSTSEEGSCLHLNLKVRKSPWGLQSLLPAVWNGKEMKTLAARPAFLSAAPGQGGFSELGLHTRARFWQVSVLTCETRDFVLDNCQR